MTTQPEHLPTDIVEARLNHLIDRARRNRLLHEEADRFTTELRDLVRRMEETEDERAHDNVALRAIARQRDEADARIRELEATVARVRRAVDAGPVGTCCAHLIHAALNTPPAAKRCGCGRSDPGPCDPCPFETASLHCACACKPAGPTP